MSYLFVDALLPVKGFRHAKGRLARLLSGAERAALAEAMFLDVLAALQAAPHVRRIWVVSADAPVRELAEARGARSIVEPADAGGLNGALEFARAAIGPAPTAGAALLVLPADLPAVMPAAIRRFLAGTQAGPFVRLCPAPDLGTNALLLRPYNAIPFRFGRDSYIVHGEEADTRELRCEVRVTPGLRYDLDRPADLGRFLNAPAVGRATDMLRELGVAERLARAGVSPERG